MHGKEKVNIIMPVYNEEKTLKEIIGRVLAQKAVDRLIIVNDHSGDRSLEIIKSLKKKDKRISYFTNESNMGKGYSVRRGLKEVDNGIVIIQDADLEYYPEDYGKLLSNLRDDTFVLGTRVRANTGHKYILASFVNACLTFEFNFVNGKDLTDINTCYKVFKKKMLAGVELQQNGFLLDLEILSELVKKGYNVREVSVRYKGRTYKEGKKITAKDAVEQVFFIIKSRFD